jgi:hypothetical protein
MKCAHSQHKSNAKVAQNSPFTRPGENYKVKFYIFYHLNYSFITGGAAHFGGSQPEPAKSSPVEKSASSDMIPRQAGSTLLRTCFNFLADDEWSRA